MDKFLLDQAKNQVKNHIENQVKEQIHNQVQKQVKSQIQAQVASHIKAPFQNQLQKQVTEYISDGVADRLANQIAPKPKAPKGFQEQATDFISGQISSQIGKKFGPQSQVKNGLAKQATEYVSDQVTQHIKQKFQSGLSDLKRKNRNGRQRADSEFSQVENQAMTPSVRDNRVEKSPVSRKRRNRRPIERSERHFEDSGDSFYSTSKHNPAYSERSAHRRRKSGARYKQSRGQGFQEDSFSNSYQESLYSNLQDSDSGVGVGVRAQPRPKSPAKWHDEYQMNHTLASANSEKKSAGGRELPRGARRDGRPSSTLKTLLNRRQLAAFGERPVWSSGERCPQIAEAGGAVPR